MISRRRRKWLATLILGGGMAVVSCPPGAPVAQSAPGTLARGLETFFYQAARPIYDREPATRLYISGYAGRRPAPRGSSWFGRRPLPVQNAPVVIVPPGY